MEDVGGRVATEAVLPSGLLRPHVAPGTLVLTRLDVGMDSRMETLRVPLEAVVALEETALRVILTSRHTTPIQVGVVVIIGALGDTAAGPRPGEVESQPAVLPRLGRPTGELGVRPVRALRLGAAAVVDRAVRHTLIVGDGEPLVSTSSFRIELAGEAPVKTHLLALPDMAEALRSVRGPWAILRL